MVAHSANPQAAAKDLAALIVVTCISKSLER
jgi:hypothetical protein